ncbi:MAG: efflux RND transporter periplasmic adaptor subunit [Nitrospinales bacterium]
MKKGFILILGVFLSASALYVLGYDNENAPANPDPEYKTVDVVQGDLAIKISATGVVEPNFKVEVKSKASGEVLTFPYEEGDFVKRGDLLLQLDKSDELRNVARAENDLERALAKLKKAQTSLIVQKTKYDYDLQTAASGVQSAEANLREARDILKRQLDLFNKQITSQEALDKARTAHKIRQEELVQARAHAQAAVDAKHDITLREDEIKLVEVEVARSRITLEEARERLEETEIFAPIDGVIIKKMVEEGQIISSGITNVSGGTALCLIADMSRLFITADVDETDIGSIQPGQEVAVTTDAFPGESFQGKVKRIAPQGEVENDITVFKVKIEITGSGRVSLKPMMTANVDIISRRVKNALYVPREAVYDVKGERFAIVLAGGRPKKIPVASGAQTPIYMQLVSGVKQGQKLVVGDWEKILNKEDSSKDKKSTLRRILWMLRSK